MTVNNTRHSVSIVIPAHNEERHLRACLRAIAAQTIQPLEVIVVDNNSTDRTVEVAGAFPFVKVVSERQQGRVFARNAGFDAAQGDIIGRIDADIVLPPNWVAHVQAFYDDPKNGDSAWSGAGYFYNVPLPGLVSWAYGKLAFGFNRLLIGHYTLWGSNMAITARQWRAVREDVCLRNDVHEDLDIAMHIHETGASIVYDTGIKTNAELRRVKTDRHQLWDYLQWWPRTLRLHGKKVWPLCWFVGTFLLYQATYVLLVADSLKKYPLSLLVSPAEKPKA